MRLDDRDVTELSPATRAELGMVRTFQHAKLFGHLTVAENILLGRHRHYRARAWQSALGLGGRAEREADAYVRDIAGECGLGEAARLEVERRYSGTVVCASLGALYRDVASRRSRR